MGQVQWNRLQLQQEERTGDAQLVEAVERSRGHGSGDKGHEITDRNDFVGVLMVTAALFCIRREQVVTKLLLGRR